MSGRRNNHREAVARLTKEMKEHRTTERRSRSFDFSHWKGGSIYAFSLTWTPGSLTIAGDIGELTLTHFSAITDLEPSLRWAARGDADYLLGKSGRRPSYDVDQTFIDIIQMANERAGDAMKSLRDELRDWRKCRVDYEGDEAAWREEKPKHEPFSTRAVRYGSYANPGMRDVPKAPGGWEVWEALRYWLCDHLDPEAIFTAKGRMTIRDVLRSRLDDCGKDGAAELCSSMGLADYYGSSNYTFHDFFQIEALRWAAARALDYIRGDVAYAWHNSLPEREAA